jgi:hypothetical protein
VQPLTLGLDDALHVELCRHAAARGVQPFLLAQTLLTNGLIALGQMPALPPAPSPEVRWSRPYLGYHHARLQKPGDRGQYAQMTLHETRGGDVVATLYERPYPKGRPSEPTVRQTFLPADRPQVPYDAMVAEMEALGHARSSLVSRETWERRTVTADPLGAARRWIAEEAVRRGYTDPRDR